MTASPSCFLTRETYTDYEKQIKKLRSAAGNRQTVHRTKWNLNGLISAAFSNVTLKLLVSETFEQCLQVLHC
jgi:hypothetical protein